MSDVTFAAAFAGRADLVPVPVRSPAGAGLPLITGLEVSEVQAGSRRHLLRITRDTGLFILGFGTVFVSLGLSATALGGALFQNHDLLTRLSGLVVVAMALFLLGSVVWTAAGRALRRGRVTSSTSGCGRAPTAERVPGPCA